VIYNTALATFQPMGSWTRICLSGISGSTPPDYWGAGRIAAPLGNLFNSI